MGIQHSKNKRVDMREIVHTMPLNFPSAKVLFPSFTTLGFDNLEVVFLQGRMFSQRDSILTPLNQKLHILCSFATEALDKEKFTVLARLIYLDWFFAIQWRHREVGLENRRFS